MPTYTEQSRPRDFEEPGGNAWATFKRKPPQAIKIEGPFAVDQTHCESGWVVFDGGVFMAVSDADFEAAYEVAEGEANG